MQPWIRSHAPKKPENVIGQPIEKLKSLITNHKKGQKPVLLYGPPGSGKTTSVHAIARELNFEIIEVNASDVRNKDAINTLLGAALKQQSLFFQGKIILVDEVDGISGTKDRGGVPALVDLIKKAHFPVVLTANDVDHKKLKPIKKVCSIIEYKALDATTIKQILEAVAKSEGVQAESGVLDSLSRRVGGDARAAINDLQSFGTNISIKDIEELSQREHIDQIQNALLRIFKTTKADVALPALDNVAEDVDKLFLWIDENIAREYTKPTDLARAYDALSEADKFFGRIRRWQYYRFYVYIYNLLSAGIALAKEEKYRSATKFKESSRILSIWMAKQKNAKKKAIAEKLAQSTHTSATRAFGEVAHLKPMFKNKQLSEQLIHELELTDDEVAWLTR